MTDIKDLTEDEVRTCGSYGSFYALGFVVGRLKLAGYKNMAAVLERLGGSLSE